LNRPLARPASNRRHQQHFISVGKDVSWPAQEADVFFIHLNVEKATHLSSLVAQVGLQFRKLLIKDRE
jgi:hypothetical protein